MKIAAEPTNLRCHVVRRANDAFHLLDSTLGLVLDAESKVDKFEDLCKQYDTTACRVRPIRVQQASSQQTSSQQAS